MTDTDSELEELKEQAQSPDRTQSREPDDQDDSLADAIVQELEAIDNGQSPNVTIRDRNLAALLRGLEERDELDELGRAFDYELKNEPDDQYTKADIGRLGLRIALERAGSDKIDALEDALVETIEV